MDNNDALNETKPAGVPICGIGASAGGLEALQKFFGVLPADLGLAYVVIVHLAPDRKSDLPAILSRWTRMPVTQVGNHDKDKLEPNHVYVIAPDRKLEITDTSVRATDFEQVRGQRAAIDLFFCSLAESRSDGFAVVLSGSGSDGALGARAVKEAGGLVLVQDPNEAAHGDMPRAVIATGVADVVLPVEELVERLAAFARDKDSVDSLVKAADDSEQFDEREKRALQAVFGILRQRTGHDFSRYKRNTVLRRMVRRMQLCHQLTIADYADYLHRNAPEAQGLFDDLLISVTTFFRDPEAWEVLQEQVIIPLVGRAEPDEQIRAWVPACATGEEAYTLAILFREAFERLSVQREVIIFASDVDEASLAIAREGLYPRAIAEDVAESRLERYFRLESDRYRVIPAIRDHVVFATHNVLRDAPFSRLHIISCRNLLIYLDHELQRQAMSIFRYACRNTACLFLGASENADEEMFQPIDKKYRIFALRGRSDGSRPPLPEVLASSAGSLVRREAEPLARMTAAEIHIAALEQAAPPSVLTDDRWNVLHLSASAAHFFRQSGGLLACRITDLVRPELRDDLHALLHRTSETREPQLSAFIPVKFNGVSHRVAMLVHKHPNTDSAKRHLLVTFLDGGEARDQPSADQEPSSELMYLLHEKLRQAEQRIEKMRDDYYLTNEDLRAANEELQSLNEEYRSTTEELETSKEELQSINEELQTVNGELKQKLEEVSHTNNDLENLMVATDMAILFLDRDCCISRFTPRLGEIFNVKARDRQRPVSDITHVLDYDTIERDARSILAGAAAFQREIRSRDGRFFVARLNPYRKVGNGEVDGLVLTFIDVTEIKGAEAALRESERKLEAELDVTRLLYNMTTAAATAPTVEQALSEILTTATGLLGAQFGNIQLLDSASQRLKILAQQGFPPKFLGVFEIVEAGDESACGRVLLTRHPVFIEDVTLDPHYAAYRAIVAEAGYRAVQSEPLITKDGKLAGVLSLHFREVHAFTDRDRQIGALIAQQAADLVASHRMAALEASEKQLSMKTAQLIEYDRNKERFLAALGHELRNPMMAIQNSLELISPKDGPSRNAVAVITRQAQHMTRLIGDLLDHARINRGTLRVVRTVVDARQTVLAATEAIRRRVEAKGLALELKLPDKPVFVRADKERLLQVLDNLLSNALIFTHRGSITLTLRQNETHALTTVHDTGEGVDPDLAATMFDPFSGTRPGTQGDHLGLGLSLVKRLVEAHGGTVSFHSEGRGRGSEVTFTLPLTHGEAPVVRAQDPDRPAAHRVLVVDDQHDIADVFGLVLEQIGQEVRVAYGAEVALATAREQRPQIAFLDLAMPGTGGEELARRLRAEFSTEELTLVALSGFAPDSVAAGDGLFDYRLLKPIDTEKVIALLNALPPRPERDKTSK